METASPRSSSARTRCDPMKPAPPVTRIFFTASPPPAAATCERMRCSCGAPQWRGGGVLFLPELEHEERPEGLSQIGAPLQMRLQKGADRGGVEDAAFLERLLRERFLEQGPQRAADPGGDGNTEALLGTAQDAAGD